MNAIKPPAGSTTRPLIRLTFPFNHHSSITTSQKPDGPRSDSRRHRVGLSVGSIGFRGSRLAARLASTYVLRRPLVSGRCCWQVAPGLGPPRPAQHEWLLAASLTQTVA